MCARRKAQERHDRRSRVDLPDEPFLHFAVQRGKVFPGLAFVPAAPADDEHLAFGRAQRAALLNGDVEEEVGDDVGPWLKSAL